MKKKEQKLVKVTSSGKVVMKLSPNLKPFVLNALEKVGERTGHAQLGRLSTENSIDKIMHCLVAEIYSRHVITLSMIDMPGKVVMTVSQALALWHYSQQYSVDFYKNPEMGNLLMQLHQTLS